MQSILHPDGTLALIGTDETRIVTPAHAKYAPLLALHHQHATVDLSAARAPKGHTRANPLVFGTRKYLGGHWLPINPPNDPPEEEMTVPPGFGGHPWEKGTPELGVVYEIPVDKIKADPAKFQYKHGADEETGVVGEWTGDSDEMEPLAVWKDADGVTNVIDGHHRLDFAKKNSMEAVPAQYLEAADADEAKAIGKNLNHWRTKEDIEDSKKDESEAISKYAKFAARARKAGDDEAADEWERIEKEEKEHLASLRTMGETQSLSFNPNEPRNSSGEWTRGNSSKKTDKSPKRRASPGTSASPKQSLFGSAGAGHPLDGLSAEQKTKKLRDMQGLADDFTDDVEGVDKAGPPSGLDMNSFASDLSTAVERHAASHHGAGVGMDVVYADVGNKYGLSKFDFLRAVNQAYKSNAIRLSGWPRMLDDLPDPELYFHAGSKGIWYVQPKPETQSLSRDASGHEHKGKGEGGGQFTSTGSGATPAKAKQAISKDRATEVQLGEPKEPKVPHSAASSEDSAEIDPTRQDAWKQEGGVTNNAIARYREVYLDNESADHRTPAGRSAINAGENWKAAISARIGQTAKAFGLSFDDGMDRHFGSMYPTIGVRDADDEPHEIEFRISNHPQKHSGPVYSFEIQHDDEKTIAALADVEDWCRIAIAIRDGHLPYVPDGYLWQIKREYPEVFANPNMREETQSLSRDAAGHEHKGKGPGGGQFTSIGGGGGHSLKKAIANNDMDAVHDALEEIGKLPKHEVAGILKEIGYPPDVTKAKMLATLKLHGEGLVSAAVKNKIISDIGENPKDNSAGNESGQWAKALDAIPHGDLHHVGGLPVRRMDEKKYRAETDTSHVEGDAEAMLAHIAKDHAGRALHGKAREAALTRAGDVEQADPFTESERARADAEGFAALPKGAKVVSLDPQTRGRVGTIVKDEQGRNRVKLEGGAGFASEHVEPLEEKHSWKEEKKEGSLIFQARKQRTSRYGKYSGKPVEVLHTYPDGKQLVACGNQRFSVYPDELTALAKPIHGSPQNYRYRNDGTLDLPEIPVKQPTKTKVKKESTFQPSPPPKPAEPPPTESDTEESSKVSPSDHKAVANLINKAGANLRNTFGKKPGSGPGPHKVFISDLYDAVKDDLDGDITLTEFKDMVKGMAAKGLLEVGRQDIVSGPDFDLRDKVQDSEVSHMNATWHHVTIPQQSSKKADPAPAESESDTADFFRQRHGKQPSLFDNLSAAQREEGGWITIGGQVGEDGKRHGGSPVYIQNGRITKGHPSLVGKKPGEIDSGKRKPVHFDEPEDKSKRVSLANPLKQEPKKPYRFAGNGIREDARYDEKLPIQTIDPSRLVSTQPSLASDSLARIQGDIHTPILVVKHGDKLYIEEGNHRAARALKDGKDVPARVIELAKDGKSYKFADIGIASDSQQRSYRRAVWAKKARQEGFKADDIRHLAADIKNHSDSHTNDVRALLKDARDSAQKMGVPIHHKQLTETGDHTTIPGFDVLARELAGRYPQILGNHGYGHTAGFDVDADQASEKLLDLLRAGNPEAISEDDAYSQAFDHLMERKAQLMQREPGVDDDEPQPRQKAKSLRTADDVVPFSAAE